MGGCDAHLLVWQGCLARDLKTRNTQGGTPIDRGGTPVLPKRVAEGGAQGAAARIGVGARVGMTDEASDCWF